VRLLSAFFLLLLAAFYSFSSAQQKEEGVVVGYRVVELRYKSGDEERKFKVALWYPSRGKAVDYDYGGGYAKGVVVPNGAVKDGKWGVAILSHGFGGSALGWVYLVKDLVKLGFVVAAPDHIDKINAVRIGKGVVSRDWENFLKEALAIAKQADRLNHSRFDYRRKEIRAVLEWLRAAASDDKSPFKDRLDPQKLVMVGHSLGSYTVSSFLGVYEKEKTEEVKAAVLLSGGIYLWGAERFAKVKAPILVMWGEKERAERRRARLTDLCKASLACLRKAKGPKYGVEVADAGHLDFAFNPRNAREKAEIHKTVRRYLVAFIRRFALNDKGAEKPLTIPVPSVTLLYPAPPAKFKVAVKRDLAYADKDPLQKLDLYLPEGAKNYPCVVMFHGGGWRAGSRRRFARFGELLAARGIAVANCDYRLAPKFLYPAFMEDAAAAVAFARKQFAAAGADTRRLFLTGHSAGAHIAALLATNAKFLKKQNLSSADIAGVAPVSGPFRITKNLFGAFGDSPDTWRDASPINHIKKGLPPFLLICGQREWLLALSAMRFQQSLQEKGVAVKAVFVPEHTHPATAAAMLRPDSEIFLRLITFFRRHKTAGGKKHEKDKVGKETPQR